MGLLILLAIMLPPLIAAAISGKKLVLLTVLIGGIPLSMVMPDVELLGSFGGVNPQAGLLFAILLALGFTLAGAMSVLVRLAMRYYAFTCFLVYAGVSILWSGDWVMGLRMYAKLVAPFLFLVAVIAFIKTEAEVISLERLIYVCALSVLVAAVINTTFDGILGGNERTQMWVQRGVLTAPYMSPANFSFLMATAGLIAAGRYLQRKDVSSALLGALFSVSVFLAFTRIAMAGFVLGFSVVAFMMLRSVISRYLLPLAIVASLFLAFITVDSFKDRMFKNAGEINLSTVVENRDEISSMVQTSGRSTLWAEAYEKFYLRSPLRGAGIGSVDSWLEARVPPEKLHSEYLRVACDFGIVGLALFVWGVAQMILDAVTVCRSRRTALSIRYGASSVGLWVLYGVTLATDNTLNYVTEFGFYVFAIFGCAIVAAAAGRPPTPARKASQPTNFVMLDYAAK